MGFTSNDATLPSKIRKLWLIRWPKSKSLKTLYDLLSCLEIENTLYPFSYIPARNNCLGNVYFLFPFSILITRFDILTMSILSILDNFTLAHLAQITAASACQVLRVLIKTTLLSYSIIHFS